MSAAEAIPNEILIMIFRNLTGTDAAACRAVCRRWRHAVDSLTDDTWKEFCCRDFCNPKIAKDVSNLSYRDLYKSLSLWSKVEQAEEKCSTKPVYDVSWFKVVNNNMVAVLRSSYRSSCSNCIEYFDIQTMTLISRRTFNFDILRCDENEYLIALAATGHSNIHIIIKSNDREIVVAEKIEFESFTLLDTELYFTSYKDRYKHTMFVSRLKLVDGEETVETVELHDLKESAVAFARAGDDGVNVLTRRGNIYSYCYDTTELTRHVQLEDDTVTEFVYVEMRRFGFYKAIIYGWLSQQSYLKEQLQITKLKPEAIHTHNHVLLGTYRCSVHMFVYKRPYDNENGELEKYKSKPDRIIDMNKYTGASHVIGSIKQVGVVETLYGHRLLVLSSLHDLYCIDLLHKQVGDN